MEVVSSAKEKPESHLFQINLEEGLADIYTQLKLLQDSSKELNDALCKLQLNYRFIKAECEEINQKLSENYKKIEKTNVEFKDILKKHVNSTLTAKIKNIFRPRIGQLYHYDPKSLLIPDKYYNKPVLNNPPCISIVTPTFNQSDFIEKTIQSVINQEYPNLEYIIQDGGSTDNTVAVLKKYAANLKHWQSEKDNGQSQAINLGFRHATGEIMAYLNSDDILMPGSLHYVANYFKNNPNVDVVYGHRILIDEHDFEIGRWVLPKHDNKMLAWADYVPQETLFWRRKTWDLAGGQIDESFKFAMDWDLLLRFREVKAKFARLPRFIGAFRVHSQQKTSATMNEIGMKEMERLRARVHGRKVSESEIKNNLVLYKLKHAVLHKLYRAGILKY